MSKLLNKQPNSRALAAALTASGFIQITDFLHPDFAGQIRQCLLNDVPWTLACRTAEGSRVIPAENYPAMPAANLSKLVTAVTAEAKAGFAFAYESYMMVTAYLDKRDPGLLLHQVLEVLNHPQTLATLANITGDTSVNRLDAQATCYRPGHFLRYHNDQVEGENRRFAFVLNLTQDWQADWGGLLQILNGRGQVVSTLTPTFNSLTLFKVPLEHCVSMVTPFAMEPRLAITGWLKH